MILRDLDESEKQFNEALYWFDNVHRNANFERIFQQFFNHEHTGIILDNEVFNGTE